jgi:hypothetical protein
MVNLVVFDKNGNPRGEKPVTLVQEGDYPPPAPDHPPPGRPYAQWMPYQVGQAKKHAEPPK